jgi:hypothetical protein
MRQLITFHTEFKKIVIRGFNFFFFFFISIRGFNYQVEIITIRGKKRILDIIH